MTRKAIHILLALFIVMGLQVSTLTVGKAQAASSDVSGKFSRNGLLLTITSQAAYEQLWGLQIKYCDGTSEQIGRQSRRGVFGPNISKGFTFYAEKPMQNVLITSLPIGSTSAAANFRTTQARRSCGTPDPLPKLACHDVQVASTIHRAWEGEPISFKSNARVYSAGLKFPGVDGLAQARLATFKAKLYAPSLTFDFKNHIWSGTFISLRVPPGTYQKVMLIIEDVYGQQAKCSVGTITVLP
jgi:hypothetical protein